MDKVTLLPKTARLKQLIKEFGSEWKQTGEEQPVQCFDGSGIFVESMCGKHKRWVRPSDCTEQPKPLLGGN